MTDNTPETIQIQKKCCPGKAKKSRGNKVRATALTTAAVVGAFALCLGAAWGINEQIEKKTVELREKVHDLRLQNEMLRSAMTNFCEAGPLRAIRCGDRTDACVCGDPSELKLGP